MNISRILVGITVAGAAAAVFSNTGPTEDKTDRDQSGEIVEAGGVGAFALRLGDCIQNPDAEGVVSIVVSVEGVPCATPHDAQVYAEFDVTGILEYDEAAVELLAQQECIDRWTEAIGTVFWEDLLLDSFSLFPSPASWAVGDRGVVCLLVSIDGSPLSGSRLRDNPSGDTP